MNKQCLCCGKPLLNNEQLWHKACIKKMFGSDSLPIIDIEEDELIRDNITHGHNVTGVQKKLSLSLSNKKKRKTISTKDTLYILKTASPNYSYLPEWEYVGMSLARIVGIETVEFGLINLKNQSTAYICKRIDREYCDGKIHKIPMEDFCQLSNVQTEYKYHGSYERCYKNVIEPYSSSPYLDALKFFKVIFFSYLIGNSDMHLKNFSLIKLDNDFLLSKAYDLLPVEMIVKQPDMALSINGKQRNITRNDFLEFGMYMDIKKEILIQIMSKIIQTKNEMINFIDNCPLPIEKRSSFKSFLLERISHFE